MAILSIANKMLVDPNGNLAWLGDTGLLTYNTADATIWGAGMTLNKSDLGEPGIEKLLNYIDIDYVGTFSMSIYIDYISGSTAYSPTIVDKANRGTAFIDIPLIQRKPFQKIYLTLASSDADCKIYSIELDFDLIKRRRFA